MFAGQSHEVAKRSNPQELRGLFFFKLNDGTYKVLDATYNCEVGRLRHDDGPGWILVDIQAPFLDWGQMTTIATFIGDTLSQEI